MLAGLLEIGISTKDRWDVLRKTLQALNEFGLGDLRLLLVDDGSQEQCPYDPVTICPGSEVLRFNESRGYIVRRNQIMDAARAPFVLQIDDDAYPVEGSLGAAVNFMHERSNALALTFPTYNPVHQKHQIRSLHQQAYQTRSFIGCAALLSRRHFTALGGYRTELVHFAEELDLAARGYQRDLYCYHYPDARFYHEESARARNWERMDYFGARNMVLLTDWFAPAPERFLQQAQNTMVRLRMSIPDRFGNLRGHIAGLRTRARWRTNRRRMSRTQYRQWRSLPTY